jgi:hypothetical protein
MKNYKRAISIVTAVAVMLGTNTMNPSATEGATEPLPREAAQADPASEKISEEISKDTLKDPLIDRPRVTVVVPLSPEDQPAAMRWLETVKQAGEERVLSLLDEDVDPDGRDSLETMLADSQAAELDMYFQIEENMVSLRFWFSAGQCIEDETGVALLYSEEGFIDGETHLQSICVRNDILTSILDSVGIEAGYLENDLTIELTLAELQAMTAGEEQEAGGEGEKADDADDAEQKTDDAEHETDEAEYETDEELKGEELEDERLTDGEGRLPYPPVFRTLAGDDHGDTFDTATPIAYTGNSWTADGSINYTGDEDWFEFETPYMSDFSVTLAGLARSVYIYSDGQGGPSYLAGLYTATSNTVTLTGRPPGTYYVRVSGTPLGGYSLTFAATEQDDCGNTAEDAERIFRDLTVEKRINYTGDVDWFKFDVARTSDFSVEYVGPACHVYIYKDNNGSPDFVAGQYTILNGILTRTNHSPGTYYVVPIDAPVGDYSVTVTGDGVVDENYISYAGPPPPPEVLYWEEFSYDDIVYFLTEAGVTMADYRALLGLQEEVILVDYPNAPENDNVYEDFYAVAWCVRNRVKTPGYPDTYLGVVSEPEQFKAYNSDYVNGSKESENCVKNAAIAALINDNSTVDDYCYFFGRLDGYHIWYDTSEILDVNNVPHYPIVPGIRKWRNVFFYDSGYVHNGTTPNPSKIGTEHIILYNHETDKWYDE